MSTDSPETTRSPGSPAFLARTQKRLWRLIANPEGVRAALAEEPSNQPLSDLLHSDERLCAEDRLDVYANAYFYRILEVLQQDYPTLAQSLGEAEFHDLATSYLAVHPSEHPSLRWIGGKLAGFLAHSPAAAGVRQRAPWASDLAAFEWAMGEAFDAADARAADRDDLVTQAPEEWESLSLELGPAVRLLRLHWPVQRLCAAQRDELPLPSIEPAATAVCIWRRDERVLYRALDRPEADALADVQRGIRFGALCERVAQELGDSDAPAQAARWLARWIDDELLRPPTPPEAVRGGPEVLGRAPSSL